jgi:hypothetical protein
VVNRRSGSGPLLRDDPIELARARLPRVRVVEVHEPLQLEQALNEAARDAPPARVRLLLSILSGRLTRSVAYERELRPELHVSASRPLRLARDGDPFEDSVRFTVGKRPNGLVIYAPPIPPAYRST